MANPSDRPRLRRGDEADAELFSRPMAEAPFLFMSEIAGINLLKRVRTAEGETTMTFSRDEMLELSLAFLRLHAMARRAYRERKV